MFVPYFLYVSDVVDALWYINGHPCLPSTILFFSQLAGEKAPQFEWRRSLFPFRKRSSPFLTVDATIGYQAFSHDSHDNKFPGLSYNKANNTFWIVLERTALKPKLNLRLKLWKGLVSPVIAVSVKKKNSLLVKVLKLFGILAGLCGCVMLREKDYDTKGPGSTLDCDLPPF